MVPPDPLVNFSAPLTQELHHQVEVVEASLANGTLLGQPARAAVGFEIDYKLFNTVQPKQRILRRRQDHLRRHLPEQIRHDLKALQPTNDEQADRRRNWLSQADQLSLSHLVTYGIYRRLSRATLHPSYNITRFLEATADPLSTIEFRYGPEPYQVGYDDNPDCGEIRTQAAPPALALARRALAVHTLQAQTRYYGFAARIVTPGHTHMSIWHKSPDRDQWQAAHHRETPHGLDIARLGAGGIISAFRDALPALVVASHLLDYPIHNSAISAGHTRLNGVRVFNDFELRQNFGEAANSVIALLTMLGGYAYGTLHPQTVTSYMRTITAPHFATAPNHTKEESLHALRPLQNCTLDTQGYLLMREDIAPFFAEQITGSFFDVVPLYNLDGQIYADFIATLYTKDGLVQCDTDKLAAWWDKLGTTARQHFSGDWDSPHRAMLRPPLHKIASKLQTLVYKGDMQVVQGSLPPRLLYTGSWGERVRELADSPALAMVLDPGLQVKMAQELSQFHRDRY